VIVGACQRWRERRGVYRPAGETIVTRQWEVAPIPDDVTARAFVQQHHYSGSYPAARRRFGLYGRGGVLSGVAVFSVPAQPKALDVLPGDRSTCAELGRFVLLDEVPANGESWFLARCFDLLRREGWSGIVSFSDPVPRTTAAAQIVFIGHVGTAYQASNAVHLGRSKPRLAKLLPDGTVLNERAVAKIRARDCGWRYAAAVLERHGAEPLREDADGAAWLRRWLPRLTRPLRHAGNLKYAWVLDSARAHQRLRRLQGLPYPKMIGLPLV
jgi:hypothetical protein